MKKIFTILASAALALTMSGCVKDTTADVNSQKGVVRTIGANIEAMTRTSMDDFEPGETAQILWSEGDVIGVVTSDGTIRQATLMDGYAGQVEGEFEVSGATEGEEYIYGFYPYNANVTYADGTLSNLPLDPNRKFITATDPATNPALPSGVTFPSNEMPMVGKLTSKGTLAFKSICGLIEVKLLADNTVETNTETTETTTTTTSIFHVSLQSDANVMSGPGVVDMTADRPKFTYDGVTEKLWNNGGSTTSFHSHVAYMLGAQNGNKGFHLNAETPTSLFFVVPVGTYDDLKIHIGDPEFAMTKVSTKSHEVKHNTILSFSAFNIHRIDEALYSGDVTDLSVNPDTGEAEYAYSYLVKPSDTPKQYKFKAVLPDGTRRLKLPDGTDVGGVNSNYNTTYVFMEDTEGVVTNLRRVGEWVYFTASKPGNAIIAIGATNTSIINSYHIWVSDVQDQVLPGGHVFMDRNLGATFAPQTPAQAHSMTMEQAWRASGCHYQWGSTIPRPGLTPATVAESYDKPQTSNRDWGMNNWLMHKWGAYLYNTAYNMSNSSANALIRTRTYPHQWQPSWETVAANDTEITNVADFGIWYRNNSSLGALNVGTNALWQSNKTMFDPCPPGYRVPSKTEMADAYCGHQYYQALKGIGQYYIHDGQTVFLSWCGYHMAATGALFNTWFTNYPRTGWWYFNEELTEDTIANDGLSIRYGTSGGGKDLNATTAAGVGASSTYPYLSLEEATSFVSGAVDTSKFQDGKIANAKPVMDKYRAVISEGMGVRCIRIKTAVTGEAGVTPGFEVETPTEF